MKLHTVYLASAAAGAAAAFKATKLDDHHEVSWVKLSDAVKLEAAQLHPILAEVLGAENQAALAAAFNVQL